VSDCSGIERKVFDDDDDDDDDVDCKVCICSEGGARVLQRPGPYAAVDAAFSGLAATGIEINDVASVVSSPFCLNITE